MEQRGRWWLGRRGTALLVVVATGILLTPSCSSSSPDEDADVPPTTAPPDDGGSDDDELSLPALGGALEGLEGLQQMPEQAVLDRLRAAADEAEGVEPSARDPLRISDTDDVFVGDAQRAWTLALAYRFTRDDGYAEASAAIVADWVDTTETLEETCRDSGCSTSLMVSRAAPGLVFAAEVLQSEGLWDEEATEELHRWLRDVIVPAASDRDGNWGDAGSFLRATAAAELGDERELERVADRWRERIDLIGEDGQIPEEVRREDAGLMYSQEALGYKVATADILDRHGIEVWDADGEQGGDLRRALDLVVTCLDDPDRWPAPTDDLRVPRPAALWSIVDHRWPDAAFADLADEAAGSEGEGHSAVLWTSLTHP